MHHPLPPGYSGPPPTPPEDEQPSEENEDEMSLDDTLPLDLSPEEIKPRPTAEQKSSKIRTFEQKLGGAKHEDSWNRTPNVTGTGAIHVKSFHCKLTGDSLDFLDQQVNEWLDAHPQYEVKLVTTAIGTWTGKLKEPHLIVNVWV
jgi:hypothetical protein